MEKKTKTLTALITTGLISAGASVALATDGINRLTIKFFETTHIYERIISQVGTGRMTEDVGEQIFHMIASSIYQDKYWVLAELAGAGITAAFSYFSLRKASNNPISSNI